MRLKLGIWAALAALVFAALLAAAPEVLKTAHMHWPVWPIAVAGAAGTALVGLARPVADALAQRWAERTKHDLDRRDRARELEHAVGGREKGLPSVGEIRDRALLGIHPSIPLPSDADPSLPPDLPLYIPRDLDGDVRAWITAHSQSGGFLLLVGPAASGKTRCAYELVHDMLGDWPMFMPSTAAQLTDYFDASPAPGKLVVWLNETQKFLGPNGLTVATVRHILALPWPVVLIGTMWPKQYDTLTASPGTTLGRHAQDSREILIMLTHRKDLLPSFTRAELDRAASLAPRDPRIAEAVSETENWNLTETLAAAPDLVSRWVNAADPYGAAVITAAVIARRCGHPEPLPAKVLESLAASVLTAADRGRAAPRWFPDALNWARVPVRGLAAPLTPQATIPGVIEGDQVSDVLVQHATRDQSAPGYVIPERTWLLLIEQATPEACGEIADVAYEQRQAHQAPITERAIRKAAAGYAGAMFNLGMLLHEQGRGIEAGEWYRKAAITGHTDAMVNLAVLLGDQREYVEAEEWNRKAAAAGNTAAMYHLALLLDLYQEEEDEDEAAEWYRKAATAGHTGAMFDLAVLLRARGEDGEAEEWYRKAATAGVKNAMVNLGLLLKSQDKAGEAEEWYRKAAAAGNTNAMFNLGVLLKSQDKAGEAEEWYRKAAADGHTNAMLNLGLLLKSQDKAGEAEEWYRKAAADEDTDAMVNLGLLLYEQGNAGEAEKLWREADKAGNKAGGTRNTDATVNLGVLSYEQGNAGEAEKLWREADKAGNPNAMFNLGLLLDGQGKAGEAEEWYRKAAAAGHTDAMLNLGVLLDGQGKAGEAEEWYRKAAPESSKE
jgi:TPR repeat protein